VTAARQLEGELDDPADLAFGVEEGVHDFAAVGTVALAGRLAEVEPAGQFAHDQHVDAGNERLAHWRTGLEHRLDRHGSQVGV
jgi:hypothetical protein